MKRIFAIFLGLVLAMPLFAAYAPQSAPLTCTATTNQIVLGTTNTFTITAPAPAAPRTLTIPDPGGASNFVMTGTAFTAGNGPTLYQMGTGTGTYQSRGVISAQLTSTGNGADLTEDTLQTFTLPANSLSANNKGVRICAWGQTAASADNKQVKLYFGATSFATGVAAANAKDWYIELVVYRTGVGTQTIVGSYANWNAGVIAPAFTAGANDETTGLVIKCTGQDSTASTANAIVCKGMVVEAMN